MSERIAELKLERWKLADIKPHPKNPRSLPPKGSKKWEILRRSLDFDYFDPLVVNRRNSMLVSGHQRWGMLIEIGFVAADVSVVDYDEPTHLARLISANTQIGEFEESLLSAIAGEIELSGIDSSLTGLDEKHFMALLDGPAPVEEPKDPEELMSGAEKLQAEWEVRLGDMFQIGEHRLLCGDCSSPDNWQLLLEGRQVDMVWTDPPYNIAYDKLLKHRNEALGGKRKVEALLNDEMPDADFEKILLSWLSSAFNITKPGGAIYLAHADSLGLMNRQCFQQAGWYLAQCLVWVKSSFTIGRQDYQWQHEPILYGWKPGAGHHWQGGYCQSTVLDHEVDLKKKSKAELIVLLNQLRNDRDTTVIREARQGGELLHPTIKPVPLVARHIWNSSRRGDTVAELFGGSGTTLAAAEQTGRKCVATELDPKYCAVILERMKSYGLEVEKIKDGPH